VSVRYSEAGFSITPIPAKDMITLNIETEKNAVIHIQITNIAGSIIYEESLASESKTLNISKLPQGLYLISIDDGKKIQTKRFVKQ